MTNRDSLKKSFGIKGRWKAVSKYSVLILEGEDDPAFDFYQELRKVARLTFHNQEGRYTEDILAELIQPHDAVMITSQHAITARVMANAPRLKIIAKRGAKPENVDLKAATERGIVVTWTPGVNYRTVAEHAVMMMLCLAKRTIPQLQRLREGRWRSAKAGLIELQGKTVGVIGLGGIGREVCKLLRCFDVELLAHDPFVSEAQAQDVGARLTSLNDLLKRSDFVTLHAALTQSTYHLIGARELSLMKKTAFIINTARGALIDEEALAKALEKGEIAGAGLDVFEKEPPNPDSPLLHLPNVVVTPHMAGWTEEAIYREQKEAAMEIKRVLEGEKPHHPVNPEAWERR